MEVTLYVGNLPKSTTGKELTSLFMQAGDVMGIEISMDRVTGRSMGYAYVTMSTQNEADTAVSRFNTYWLEDQQLKVMLARPRDLRGFRTGY